MISPRDTFASGEFGSHIEFLLGGAFESQDLGVRVCSGDVL